MRILKNLLKILISVGLMAWLIKSAEPRKIFDVFGRAQQANGLLYLFVAFGLTFLAVLFLSLRWHVLLKGYGFPIKRRRLYGFYLIGMFFNNFLPTSIGGDVVRIYKIVEDTSDRTAAFASVIIERMMGIAATLLLAIVSLFFLSQSFHNNRLLLVSVVLFLAIAIFFAIVIRKRPFHSLLRLFDKFTFFHIGEKINKLFEAIHYFSRQRRILVYVFCFSLLSQTSVVLMNYCLAKAFSLQIEMIYLFMVVPVTFALTMLPSINGIGIRDLGYVSLLGQIGVSNAGAISLSFMNVVIPMFVSVFGAVLFVTQKRKSKMGEIDAIESSF